MFSVHEGLRSHCGLDVNVNHVISLQLGINHLDIFLALRNERWSKCTKEKQHFKDFGRLYLSSLR